MLVPIVEENVRTTLQQLLAHSFFLSACRHISTHLEIKKRKFQGCRSFLFSFPRFFPSLCLFLSLFLSVSVYSSLLSFLLLFFPSFSFFLSFFLSVSLNPNHLCQTLMPNSDCVCKQNNFLQEYPLRTASAQRFSLRKYLKSLQTWLLVSSMFWYWEYIANSHGKFISQRSAFIVPHEQIEFSRLLDDWSRKNPRYPTPP